jgi:hypothetical protein
MQNVKMGGVGMATIWFLEEGPIQGPPAAEKSLGWCVKNLGLRADDWIAPQNSKPELAAYRGFCYVVVQVSDADLTDTKNWKTGFYLLEKDATRVRKILQNNPLDAMRT